VILAYNCLTYNALAMQITCNVLNSREYFPIIGLGDKKICWSARSPDLREVYLNTVITHSHLQRLI